MKKLYVVLVLGLAVGVVCWAFGPSVISAKDTDVKVKIEELPKAVKDTVDKFIADNAPGAKFDEAKKEIEKDGKVIYDVELEAGDKDVELEIAEDGTLIEQEVDEEEEEKEGEEGDEEDKDEGVTVSFEELPQAVKDTVNNEKGEIGEIEKEEEDGKVIYDVDVKIEGKKFELKIAANGTVLKKEAEEEKEEKEGEERDEEDNDDGVTVALEDLPSVVKATVEAQGGEIGEIEKEEEDGEVVYDVDVKIDGKKFELKIAADGTLLKKNTDEDKDGDEEDDDNDGDEE